MKIDSLTRKWIRNESDEKAAANGCWFDEGRGQLVIDWAEENLVLWEGDCAGQPLVAQDWQHDCTMRMFGWVKKSKRWGRDIRRFREALIGKPKKSKKSPTVAWWMLYLLDGDGEQGQNCYSAAKNGDQARIVQNHAVKMVQASPTLGEYMRINKSTLAISVDETNSSMKVLSSDNARTQKAKEGLNGSCSVDELHVVDEEFIRRIYRMGISRSEPMFIQVTTAGDDPLSYGRTRYDYGKRVESGDFDAEGFFFDWHEAPQDLTMEGLSKDPIKFGKLANPSWGHTVHEEEYTADYQACDTQASLRDFMKYRLNIWQTAANPWLNGHDWKDCQEVQDIPEHILQAAPCWAGLDLSKTKDLTALALCFLVEEQFHFRWWFWIPDKRAKALASLVPFRDWEEDPRAGLTITDEDWIDYHSVWETLLEVGERYRLQKLLYDPRFASYLIQRVQEGGRSADGETQYPPASFEIVECPQTVAVMTEPIEEFEKLVVSRKLRHNGNPVATWQAGHVGQGRNGLLVKPGGSDDIRTIDGIQSAVMALAGAESGEYGTAYATPGSGVILF